MGLKDKLREAAGSLKEHLAHRLNPNTIVQEFVDTMEKRVQPQGAEEISNLLFNGSAYWPGMHPGASPIQAMPEIGVPQDVAEIAPPDPTPDQSKSLHDYMTGYADHPANRDRDGGLDR